MCPGSFSYALNSPERGEGRWAQNYAKMLAKAGHDVYAASGWCKQTPKEEYGVKLLDQSNIEETDFDLYIDAAWWDNKVPAAKAKKYVALKWSPEDYLYKPFNEDFYLAYPYTSHHYNFSRNNFPNRNKTFALPTWFGVNETFEKPNWDKERIFLPGKIDVNRPYHKYLDVIAEFLNRYVIEGTSRDFFEKEFGNKINFNKPGSKWSEIIPYYRVLSSLAISKISLPILNPGCIIEAASMGVPSIFWEHGGFFNPLAVSLNMLIEHDAPPERFTEVTEMLMNSKKKYYETTYALQDYFVSHTYAGAMKYFNLFCEEVGLT